MLDVRKLRALRAIARCGSFSAAAEDLNYSQSAISQQVAQLERQVGTLLVERHGRSVSLTLAGRKLVDRAERILRHMEEAEAELAAITALDSVAVRVVTTGAAAAAWMPDLAARFHHRHPGHPLSVTATSTVGALELVALGEADIAVLPAPARVPTPSLATVELFDDHLHLLLPANHSLATNPSVKLSDLADEPWVVTSQNNYDDLEELLTACRTAGFEPRIAQLARDVLALQDLVATGGGVALVPGLVCNSSLRRDVLARPLDPAEFAHALVAVTSGELPKASPSAALLDVMRDIAAERDPLGRRPPSAASS